MKEREIESDSKMDTKPSQISIKQLEQNGNDDEGEYADQVPYSSKFVQSTILNN